MTRPTGFIDERVQMKLTEAEANATAAPTFKMATTTSSGDGESALYRVSKTSANAVRAGGGGTDAMPVFPQEAYEREVAENSETDSIVGLPVEANYTGGMIEYEIDPNDANDNRFFYIDPNGQIRVGSVLIPSPTPAGQFAAPTEGGGQYG